MAPVFRFRDFELDENAFELRRNQKTLKLERLAMKLLILLVNNRQRVVSRHEIAESLWGKGVFLDSENGVNTAIRKIRRTLKDQLANPRFVRTVPGVGYQFVAEVATLNSVEPPRDLIVAVLPFQNLEATASDDYFAEGITEETIAILGTLAQRGLSVIARTSSMVYKNSQKTIKQVARELGAQYIVESGLRRDNGRVRITARLIRASDQIQVWSSTYDREVMDLFTAQREIAVAIAEQVNVKLTAFRGEAPQKTTSVTAFDEYLRGRYLFARRTPVATLKAIEHYKRAIDADPNFSLAYAGLGDAYCTLPITADVPTESALSITLPAAQRAIALDCNSAEAWTTAAGCRFWLEWDWEGAIAAARRAIQLNPSYALAHFFLAHTFSNLQRHDEARSAIQEAIRLDPFSVHLHATSGQMWFQARDFERGAQEARTALSLNSESWLALNILGKNLLELGHIEESLSALQRALQLAGCTSEPLALKAVAFCRLGNTREAREIWETMLQIRRQRGLPACNLALVALALGEREESVQWLLKAAQERDVRLIFFGVDIKWSPLYGEPRLQGIWPPAPGAVSKAAS